MPRLNIMTPVAMGAERSEADQGALDIVNGYIDAATGNPTLRTRPGLKLINEFPGEKRTDLYWWEAKRILITVSDSRIYAKSRAGAAPVEITPSTIADRFTSNSRVFFTADEHGVTMCAGTFLLWWNGSSATAQRITDPNLPNTITALTYLKGYTIAAEANTQRFYYALYGPLDSRSSPPPWSPLFSSASAHPDDIVTLGSGWEELFVLGRESTQAHYASGDADIPFPALNGSVSEVGTINNRTLQKLGNTWIFLTPNKQVVRMEGRNPQVISQSIDKTLRRVRNFIDAEAFVLFERFYVLTFAVDQRTFVYDLTTGLWYRWQAWDRRISRYRVYPGITAVHAKPWGMQMVGGYKGELFQCDYDYALDDDEPIHVRLRSSELDHGTLENKFSSELMMRLRRGES